MILPIVPYGNSMLRRKCDNIEKGYPNLSTIIDNMWITMFASNGIGLAAPQVNLPIRLFIIETLKKVFINPEIVDKSLDSSLMKEGCLSIPGIGENIERPNSITIKYYDEDFILHKDNFDGMDARVIQHEYDHIEGKLFIDYVTGLKRKLIKGKLNDIVNDNIITKYKMLR